MTRQTDSFGQSIKGMAIAIMLFTGMLVGLASASVSSNLILKVIGG